MDALRKQASKAQRARFQATAGKQFISASGFRVKTLIGFEKFVNSSSFVGFQAMKKQFSGSGYESSDSVVIDEVELQRHQQLEKLYRTTRAGREFQRDIVRAAEALTAIGYKHIEAETKLSEDCCRYGSENDSDTMLAKAVAIYGDACKNVEKETVDLNRVLSLQVLEPLRAMITAGPLEDARHLAQRVWWISWGDPGN
ncbi:SH3 domain-containing protein 3 [Linum grandiflorum]